MALMDFGGYSMGKYSNLSNFESFIIIFAAPWVIWIIIMLYTILYKSIKLHAFIGNMILKGCISVPLARVSGSFL